MVKLTKKQIKSIAVASVANTLQSIDLFSFQSDNVELSQQIEIVEEIEKIAKRLKNKKIAEGRDLIEKLFPPINY
jgi:hypothetical protein